MQGAQQALQYLLPSTTSLCNVPLSFQSLSVSGDSTLSPRVSDGNNADTDIAIDNLSASMNRSGLYSRPFLGTPQRVEDSEMEGLPRLRLGRQPFVIPHPRRNTVADLTMQDIIGAFSSTSLSGSREHLTSMRTFSIGPRAAMDSAVRGGLDFILRGDRSTEVTQARISRLAGLLYRYGGSIGCSRTRSVICRRVMSMLDELANDAIKMAMRDKQAALVDMARYYRFCWNEFKAAVASQVKCNAFFWDPKLVGACSPGEVEEKILSGALPLPAYSAQIADLYAARIIEPEDFLDALEKTILPGATTPKLLYIAVFFYVSRGLSSRSLKLFPATWSNIYNGWAQVEARFPECQTPGSADWGYMQHIKEAILILEADSTIQGELACLLPFKEEPSDDQKHICDFFIHQASLLSSA